MEAPINQQLDFNQAMSDFSIMFPTIRPEMIESVLRANDGSVDATIDELLTRTAVEAVDEANYDEPLAAVHVPTQVALPDSSAYADVEPLPDTDLNKEAVQSGKSTVQPQSSKTLVADGLNEADVELLSSLKSNGEPQASGTVDVDKLTDKIDYLQFAELEPPEPLPPLKIPTEYSSSSEEATTPVVRPVDSSNKEGSAQSQLLRPALSPKTQATGVSQGSSSVPRRLDWLEDSSSSSSPPPQEYMDQVSEDMLVDINRKLSFRELPESKSSEDEHLPADFPSEPPPPPPKQRHLHNISPRLLPQDKRQMLEEAQSRWGTVMLRPLPDTFLRLPVRRRRRRHLHHTQSLGTGGEHHCHCSRHRHEHKHEHRHTNVWEKARRHRSDRHHADRLDRHADRNDRYQLVGLKYTQIEVIGKFDRPTDALDRHADRSNSEVRKTLIHI